MATFPLLNTGAVTQYPMRVETGQAVQAVRFLDGSEQRFLNQGRQFRRWEINLTQLSESEIYAIEDFFEQQSGDYSLFVFPDPSTQQNVLNCRLANAEFAMQISGLNSATTNFWVIETNG